MMLYNFSLLYSPIIWGWQVYLAILPMTSV